METKADIIYIDPPFNSGMGSFAYKNATNTNWEHMIEQRLIIAKKLLSDSGVVFICIDDNQEHILKKICHSIFGEENFVGSIILANYKTTHISDFANNSHEYILVYAKTKHFDIKKITSSVWDKKDVGDSAIAYSETKKYLKIQM